MKDFKRVRLENFYYVDKSSFIEKLEQRANFLFFVCPRRFGKSMLCEMLRCYYDVAEKENFEKLFGGLYAGAHPTANVSKHFVLPLDFSFVGKSTGATWNEKFERYLKDTLRSLIDDHAKLLKTGGYDIAAMKSSGDAGSMYTAVRDAAKRLGYGLYVIVDEYDNFTNDIVSTAGKLPYKEITHGTGIYRGWFELFKGTADRIFMTGVSPVTMDDLTSGFNIATNITLEPKFHAMVGLTHSEVRKLFEDFSGCGDFTSDVEPHLETVRAWYDSYCFAEEKVGEESLYNCDMVLYYLSKLVATGGQPKNMIDSNIRSDWSKLNMILAAQRHAETWDETLPLTEELADQGEVTFPLVESFPIENICDEKNFKSLYYYYGIVTMGRVHRGHLLFRVPNECVRLQIFEYMRGQYEKRPNAVDTTEFIDKFDAFAWDGEWCPFLTYLAEHYRDNGSTRDGIDGEARINGYVRAYLTLKNSYMVHPEMSHPMGFSDYALFPNRALGPNATPVHAYLIEMKYSKPEATDVELAAKYDEAVEQLTKYRADPNVAKHAGNVPIHCLVYRFKGRDLVRLEEVKF